MSVLVFFAGCKNDSESDSSSDDEGDGSGCIECAHGAVYSCYCQVDGDFEVEYDNRCPSNPPSNDADCSVTCEGVHGDDTPSEPREASCAAESSISCTNWSPSSYITFTSNVYHVDSGWLSSVVADPEPLWGCDDAVITVAGVGEFEIDLASSGEALYTLGLRNGDIPVALNGQSLGTFSGAFAAFSQYLNGETEYTLVVLRSSVPFALYYEID